MLVFHNISGSFLVISVIFGNFAAMAKEQYTEDLAIAQKLIDRDSKTTEHFFFEECSGIFYFIISHFFSEVNDWEEKRLELINQFYLYVIKSNALKRYRGDSKLKTYLRQVAYYYFKRLVEKEEQRKEAETKFYEQEQLDRMLEDERKSIKSNVRQGIAKMKDERNAFILQKMFVEDFTKGEIMLELDVNGSHFDVLKGRAKKEFTIYYLKLKDEENE
jgi:hypothetical protein